MHSFFVPSPSPMYEERTGREKVVREAVKINAASAGNRAHFSHTFGSSQVNAARTGTAEKKVNAPVKPREFTATNTSPHLDKHLDKHQNGLLDIFFHDHSVALDARKAKAVASIRAKHTSISRKSGSANEHEMVAADTKVKSAPQTSAAAARTAPVKSKPNFDGSPVNYGGIFGDPFADNPVRAADAHNAAPSWF
jgi:hypothetical protein